MQVLQMVYFWFRQHCETANQTHGGETSLPVDSRNGGYLSNAKGGPLYCPYSWLPAAKKGSSLTQTRVTSGLRCCRKYRTDSTE
jgi:hypothetical protein